MDEASSGSTCQVLGLGLVIRYHSELEVPRDQFLLVGVRAGRLGDSHYFICGFPA
jgi:hypothetical protein